MLVVVDAAAQVVDSTLLELDLETETRARSAGQLDHHPGPRVCPRTSRFCVDSETLTQIRGCPLILPGCSAASCMRLLLSWGTAARSRLAPDHRDSSNGSAIRSGREKPVEPKVDGELAVMAGPLLGCRDHDLRPGDLSVPEVRHLLPQPRIVHLG